MTTTQGFLTFFILLNIFHLYMLGRASKKIKSYKEKIISRNDLLSKFFDIQKLDSRFDFLTVNFMDYVNGVTSFEYAQSKIELEYAQLIINQPKKNLESNQTQIGV